jgi:hypothetical protein
MLALAEIENAIEHLPRQEFSSFSAWFEKCEAERWDKEIKKDIDMELLDSLGKEAIAEFNNGSCKKI